MNKRQIQTQLPLFPLLPPVTQTVSPPGRGTDVQWLLEPMNPMNRNNSEESACSTRSRSSAIPIHKSIRRTLSEEQLQDEENLADMRDYAMFNRLVTGITKRQQETYGYRPRLVNDICLSNIIGTRNLSEEELRELDRSRLQHLTPNPPTSSADDSTIRMMLEDTYHQVYDDDMFELEL